MKAEDKKMCVKVEGLKIPEEEEFMFGVATEHINLILEEDSKETWAIFGFWDSGCYNHMTEKRIVLIKLMKL